MATFSAVMSTIAALYALLVIPNAWQALSRGQRFLAVFAAVYLITMTVSGCIYVKHEKRCFGKIHLVLMFGVATLGFVVGVFPIVRGAYIRESLDALGVMLDAVIGMLALACALGVFWDLRSRKSNTRNDNL